MPEERRQNLAETNRGSFYNQEEWLEEFLDDKGAFYNSSERDDGDNDGKNYDENMEVVVHWNFFLIKLQAQMPATLLKTDSNTRLFL